MIKVAKYNLYIFGGKEIQAASLKHGIFSSIASYRFKTRKITNTFKNDEPLFEDSFRAALGFSRNHKRKGMATNLTTARRNENIFPMMPPCVLS